MAATIDTGSPEHTPAIGVDAVIPVIGVDAVIPVIGFDAVIPVIGFDAVIPAKAGTQSRCSDVASKSLGSRFRGNDAASGVTP